MILNTKEFTSPFEERELNECLQKLYLSVKKATSAAVRSLRAKIVIGCNSK